MMQSAFPRPRARARAASVLFLFAIVLVAAFGNLHPGTVQAVRAAISVPIVHDDTILGSLPNGLRPDMPLSASTPLPLPTNAWWSSGVLDQWPAPLFAWPLVTTFGENGISIDAPGIETLPKAVVAAAHDALKIGPANGTLSRATVRSWGDWDVTFDARIGESSPFSVTAVQGSPYVFVTARTNLALTLPVGSTAQPFSCSQCGSALVVTAPRTVYLLVTSPAARIQTDAAGTRVVGNGSEALLTVAVVAPGTQPADYLPYALQPVQNTRVTFRVLPDRIETTYRFPTETLMGLLPHHLPVLATNHGQQLGSYDTVHGTIRLLRGNRFTTRLPRPAILPGLPLTQAMKNDPAFLQTLARDVAEHRPGPAEAYEASKNLLRTATLAELADETGNPELRSQAITDLRAKLADWCTATPGEKDHFFAYDTVLGGIIAIAPGYGSEHFNDHHFHYGYFLRAGATLARLDPSFMQQHGDCMRLLAKDIASTRRFSKSFPAMRYFDVYAGHSWANGLTRFNDGQNQESTSEAMQAWFGLALWGRVSGDKPLEELGNWLLAQEAQSTRAYWFNALPGQPTLPPQFGHPMISLKWGGKVDYATFFDPSPEAVQGIQFFPVTTALLPVVDSAILAKLVTPLSEPGSLKLWKTNMNLATALTGNAPTIPPSAEMDSAYSPSSRAAWIGSLQRLGAYQSQYHPVDSCTGAVFGNAGRLQAVIYRHGKDPTTCAFTNAAGPGVTQSNLQVGWNVRPL